jgi:hypothetical protein
LAIRACFEKYSFEKECPLRNYPKSPDRLRAEASEVHLEIGSKKPYYFAALGIKMEASEATLDPFRTVSEGVFSEIGLPRSGRG